MHDEHRPEDINTKGEDHIPDAIRYLLMHIGRPDAPNNRPKTNIEKLIDRLAGEDDRSEYVGIRLYRNFIC